MKKRMLWVLLVLISCVCFVACQEEDNVAIDSDSGGIQGDNAMTIVDTALSIVSDGVRWHYIVPSKKETISKGFSFETDESIISYCQFSSDGQDAYPVMKVQRRNSDKYFYVMVKNLDLPYTNGGWAYGDDERNVDTYGRLYTWTAAYELQNSVKMKLPIYKADGTPLKVGGNICYASVYGKFMSHQDFDDIIECDTVGWLPESGYGIEDMYMTSNNFYYDTFLGGIETGSGMESDAYGSLGGFRDTQAQNNAPLYVNYFYLNLNREGGFWLKEGTGRDLNGGHRVLNICRTYYSWYSETTTYYDWTAYSNVTRSNKYGYSVRYIFEPVYRER